MQAETYTSGENVKLDNELVIWDVYGSLAHVKMLYKIGLLDKPELAQLTDELKNIIELFNTKQFSIEQGDEDVHTKIENYITHTIGHVGEKIHTGRSRNDQVLVDLRLYGKDGLFQVIISTLKLSKQFAILAKKYEFIPMPGYTHMQKAMLSSVGMWLGSFSESLLDDMLLLQAAFQLNNQSPLGSGAAYGVSLPLDRTYTSNLLGFEKVQNNSLYCQTSRVKIQLTILHAFVQIMSTLSRFAQDVLIFTMHEFSFFTISQELCTGSSIMPQKNNADILEILKARTSQMIANQQVTAAIGNGFFSGYNADFQETKKPFIESLKITLDSINIISLVLDSLEPNKKTLLHACTNELFAAHAAYELVKQGIPFRKAYQIISDKKPHYPAFPIKQTLTSSNHLGATGNLGLDMTIKQVDDLEKIWTTKHTEFTCCLEKLKGGNNI